MNRKKSATDQIIAAFSPSLEDLIFIAVFLLVLAFGWQMLSIDSDLGRHLTLGNYILDNRTVPAHDLFSHTLPNQPRPPYEWLSQILLALANRLLGLDGVILLTAIIIAATFTLLFQFASHRSGSPIIAFVVTLIATGASSIHWLPRPHIITFLFLVIWVEKLEQLKNDEPGRLFTFPLLMIFWANLHGGFIFGLLAWGAYMIGRLIEKWQRKTTNSIGRKLLLAGLFSLFATTVTPSLWRNWEAVLNNRSTFILSRTAETMPPNLTIPSVLPFTLLLALTVTFFLVNRKTLSASHFFLLAGLGVMSLLMARNIPLFAIACTPILSRMIKTFLVRSNAWRRSEERFAGFGRQNHWYMISLTFTLGVIVFFINSHIANHRSYFQFNPQVFPVEAMDWLATHPQNGKMFNEFNWGGYILYRSWPAQQVFLDSQSDFYGEALMKDYEQIITTQRNWENLLGKYQVSWAIIPSNSSLFTVLLENQDWETEYKDETAIIIHKSYSPFP